MHYESVSGLQVKQAEQRGLPDVLDASYGIKPAVAELVSLSACYKHGCQGKYLGTITAVILAGLLTVYN